VSEQAEQGRISPPAAQLGWRTRLALVGHRLQSVAVRGRLRLAVKSERLADRILDRGLETSDSAAEPEHDHPDRVAYHPSPWYVLPRALRYLRVSDQDVFVDFGCGKGRVVHQAAKRPFRRVVGVEISPSLAEVARNGLTAKRHQHRCRDVEIVVADVGEFEVPDDLTIGYLYHPFQDETFERLVRAIIDSLDRNPRRIRLIYFHPFHSSQLLATGRFRLVKEQRSGFFDTRPFHTGIFESR
jgi:SAM-dependent methyltransferase